RTETGLSLKGTKTAQVRRVPLNAPALAALHAHRARQLEQKMHRRREYADSDFVFADELGQPWHLGSISNAFARTVAAAGLERVRLHDLRHTCASWLLNRGTDVRTVAAILGHSSATTTLSMYAHVMPGAEAAAVQRIALEAAP
ncbi:MAG TPA: tyrosine-type recombinase/integrase, partial [Candidatus Baltobacteraceae bacterium]|nr:tyrosine-type recombinase/integrase [Candidatus Baltobacteraceae bacterium]